VRVDAVQGALAAALVTVLLLLGAVHLYWAFGGRVGAAAAVPEVGGKPAFRPGRSATLLVAALLAAAAGTVGLRALAPPGPGVLRLLGSLGVWTLCAVFALRAAGDFRTFGLFKTVRESRFARLDTLLYTPLCLAISLGCLAVALGP